MVARYRRVRSRLAAENVGAVHRSGIRLKVVKATTATCMTTTPSMMALIAPLERVALETAVTLRFSLLLYGRQIRCESLAAFSGLAQA